jgi:hypothetical protein
LYTKITIVNGEGGRVAGRGKDNFALSPLTSPIIFFVFFCPVDRERYHRDVFQENGDINFSLVTNYIQYSTLQ